MVAICAKFKEVEVDLFIPSKGVEGDRFIFGCCCCELVELVVVDVEELVEVAKKARRSLKLCT